VCYVVCFAGIAGVAGVASTQRDSASGQDKL